MPEISGARRADGILDVTDDVIETDYDPSRMQDQLFIIPSFAFLRREIEQLVKRFGLRVAAKRLQLALGQFLHRRQRFDRRAERNRREVHPG